MDIATIIGILSGIFLILFSILRSGGLMTFVEVGALMITIGGTIAATLINFPLADVVKVIGVVKKAFLHKAPSPEEAINTLVSLAEKARREGILVLEKEIKQTEDDFLSKGIELAVDGTEPEVLRDILNTELEYLEERHELGQDIFLALGNYAPAFGMIGTLIGLVLMLRSMENPSQIGSGMAIALLTTFYGVLLANLLFLPIAGKLKTRTKQEVLVKELIIEGISAIQSGHNPRMVRQKLICFIPPKVRAAIPIRRTARKQAG